MKTFVLACLFALLAGCSVFKSGTQDVTVVTVPPSDVYLNGEYHGHGVVKATVPRDRSVTVMATHDDAEIVYRFVQSVPSFTGRLDAAGAYFLFPAIGLFSPGAMELETDLVTVHVGGPP